VSDKSEAHWIVLDDMQRDSRSGDMPDNFAGLPYDQQGFAGQIDHYDFGRRRITPRERLDRLEDIAVLLAQEAAQGQGSMGNLLWAFVDAIRAERKSVSQT